VLKAAAPRRESAGLEDGCARRARACWRGGSGEARIECRNNVLRARALLHEVADQSDLGTQVVERRG
jgi:hypothetical protein